MRSLKAALVNLHDKFFEPYLAHADLQKRIGEMAVQINSDFDGEELYLLVVLSGAYRFAADLSAGIKLKTEVGFVKVSSYIGIESSGEFNVHLAVTDDLKGKNVLVIEDIVDTGNTLEYLLQMPALQGAKSVKIASLLFKPEAYKKEYKVHYQGFSVPNLFVVGYGLDYKGLGRNLNEIYQLK